MSGIAEVANQLILDSPHAGWFEGVREIVFERSQLGEAETFYTRAVELQPDNALAYNNLGWIKQMQGNSDEAAAHYRRALDLKPGLHTARRNLATLLVRQGRQSESFPLWHEELAANPGGLTWLQNLISRALRADDLTLAGEYASIAAQLRWASSWYPARSEDQKLPLPVKASEVFLTVPKLRHDIEQFEYLQSQGLLGLEFTEVIKEYEKVIERLEERGITRQVPLDPESQKAIGHVFNRIVYIDPAPRLPGSVFGNWNPADVENNYLNKPPGLVVIDDFLSHDALEGLRRFCLNSTVWSANRYANGRLGAFFHDGFNGPLLRQIAEELRRVLPKIIIDRYPLRQMWGFKNGQYLPAGSTVHADFAAVNVNFWITPTEANLDEKSGGLVVYNLDAPLTWDFSTYNGRADIIKPFLLQQGAREVHIPYRQNRAVIFNSDLFHASAGLQFKGGYENRRINVTMLYGDRESDVHHSNIAGKEMMGNQDARSVGWRSAAFTRARTRPGGF
jgi:tetratricopeptide (TPR) repeat protein